MTELIFTTDDQGNLSLTDTEYDGDVFRGITLFPSGEKTTTLRNIRFKNCKTSPGTCMIGGNTILENVVFENFNCGDAIDLYSEVTLNQVTFIGPMPPALIVQPLADNQSYTMPSGSDVEYHLDIVNFPGDVTIVGLHGNKIRKDLERHVTIKARWKEEVDWDALGIGPFSFWRLYLKRLVNFGVEEGVFSLPKPTNKRFDATMRERQTLEDLGLCFD